MEEVLATYPLEVIKVPQAVTWAKRLHSNLPKPDDQEGSHTSSTTSITENETPILSIVKEKDWTYSTDYCCTLITAQSDQLMKQVIHSRPVNSTIAWPVLETDSASELNLSEGIQWQWDLVSECGIDYEILKNRELPILFYDEINLYEVIFDNNH
jgi:hypothetical protein